MKRLMTLLAAILFVSSISLAQNIIPKPNQCAIGKETLVLDNPTIGYSDASLKAAADYLAGIIRPATGFKTKVQKKKSAVNLEIDKSLAANAYVLTVGENGVLIQGGDYRGVICGIQTLRQLLPVEIEARQKAEGVEWAIPYCYVSDQPRYGYRGLELDVSRHFFTKQEVKDMLDVMALYKLNKLHWHLTDDQGWRIEIKRYPKLTENGAWREYNDQDRMCNARADREQNEDMRVPTDRYKVVDGKKLYGGFYTQNDIREIVEYARVRGIDIIPEIDMPGHMLAAELNYDGIICAEMNDWTAGFTSPLCPGKEETMEFCKAVIDEVVALFPYEYFHIGGDEVEKRNWKVCPDCQKRMKDKGLKTEEELQSWFIHEMEKYLNSKGKKMIGWNEIIEGGLSDTSTIMWWGSWVKDAPFVTTSHGNDMIDTHNDLFYLDYDEGDNAMKNIYNYDTSCGLPENLQKHLLGVQGNIWCERIPTMNRMWYMTANRMLAIAELGWSAAEPKNYYAFEDRMLAQIPRFEVLGVRSKVMPIEGFNKMNAFVGEGRYNITCKDKSAVIRYTTDGSIPTVDSPAINGELVLTASADYRFATFRKDGSRSDVVSAKFVKDDYAPAVEANPTKNGLTTEWHEFPGIDCEKIASAPLNATYHTQDVIIPEGVKGNIGLITTGYIYVPEDGIYTFILTSDDGSDLFVDNTLIVDMNKEQSPQTEVGEKALKRGYHAIRVRYFDHNGGMLKLVVKNQQGAIMDPKEFYYTK